MRQIEINECLQNNINNDKISKIILLVENIYDLNLFENYDKKVMQVVIGKRLSFYDVFEYYNNYLSSKICVLANADIYLDNNIINTFDYHNTFYAINRYEKTEMNIYKQYGVDYDLSKWSPWVQAYSPCVYSQDSWMWKMNKIKSNCTEFYLGLVGCDNLLVGVMYHIHKYNVYNPSNLFPTIHYDLHSEMSDSVKEGKGSLSHKRLRVGTFNDYLFLDNIEYQFNNSKCIEKYSNSKSCSNEEGIHPEISFESM